jgi:hypothetical protein
MQQAFIVHTLGKISTISAPYMLCSNEHTRINNDEDNRDLLFEVWWKSELYLTEKKYFIEVLSRFLHSTEAISVQDSRKLIQAVFDLFVDSKLHLVSGKNSLERRRIREFTQFPAFYLLVKLFPTRIRGPIRERYFQFIQKRTFHPLELICRKAPSSIEIKPEIMNDLREIEKLIITAW